MNKLEYEKKLESLKNLLNGGIITKDEYNDQRRRYKEIYSKGDLSKKSNSVEDKNYIKSNGYNNNRNVFIDEVKDTFNKYIKGNSDSDDSEKNNTKSFWATIIFIIFFLKIIISILD